MRGDEEFLGGEAGINVQSSLGNEFEEIYPALPVAFQCKSTFFFFFLNSVLIFIIPTVSIINHCLLYKFTPKKVLFI